MFDMASKPTYEHSLVPYACLYIDATLKDILSSIKYLIEYSDRHREQITTELQHLWTSRSNLPTKDQYILLCLCVRTAFDLYLRVKKYPPGSEILMTAINIPQMVDIVHHHGLRVVPVDISVETLAPKTDLLESLISEKSVAIVIAHLYGRWSRIDKVVEICLSRGLAVIEDCAQVFCGFTKQGHRGADISLFSFGSIKANTAFGGAVARIKDPVTFQKMLSLNLSYPIQSRATYLKKILKCVIGMMALNAPISIIVCLPLLQVLKIDHKKAVVAFLRGFTSNLILLIRHQPSMALLRTMLRRFEGFDEATFQEGNVKCDYVSEHLSPNIEFVGIDTETRNYWLFPIVVEEPEKFLTELNRRWIDAYRGATQLTCIEPRPLSTTTTDPTQLGHALQYYPHEARYLIDHVIYLPVHKRVPYSYLEKICVAVEDVMHRMVTNPFPKRVNIDGKTFILKNGQLKMESKL